jgi:hypothetical protein
VSFVSPTSGSVRAPRVRKNSTVITPVFCGWYVPTKKGYAGRQRARWVLGVSNGRVLYSRGGELHYECTRRWFATWIKRVGAEFNPLVVESNKPKTAQLEIV